MLCGYRKCRWLGGNAPEDHGSGLLDGFQALAQEIGVSVPKLDVVLGCGSVLEAPTDWQTTKATRASASVSRTWFGGQSATVAAMQHFVGDLMRERGKLLGWLHPGK